VAIVTLGFPLGLFVVSLESKMNSLIICSLWILFFCQWVWVTHCFVVSPVRSFGRLPHHSKRKVHVVFSSFPRNRGFARSRNVEQEGVEHRDRSRREYELMVEQLRNYDDINFHQILTKLCDDEKFQNFAFWYKKNDLIEIFRKWNTHERSNEEVLHVLKAASSVFSMQDATEKVLLHELIRSYLDEKKKSFSYLPQFLVSPLRRLGLVKDQKKSPSDFASFLTALRKIHFNWIATDSELKQNLLNNLNNVVIGNNEMDENSFAEILVGLYVLGIHWRELPEHTRETVVGKFFEMKDKWNASSSIKAMNSFRRMGGYEAPLDYDEKMNIFLKALIELEQNASGTQVFFFFI
jgi:hypothetical protein